MRWAWDGHSKWKEQSKIGKEVREVVHLGSESSSVPEQAQLILTSVPSHLLFCQNTLPQISVWLSPLNTQVSALTTAFTDNCSSSIWLSLTQEVKEDLPELLTAVYPRLLAQCAGTIYFINTCCLSYRVTVKCVDSGIRLTKFKYRALIYFSYMILGKPLNFCTSVFSFVKWGY